MPVARLQEARTGGKLDDSGNFPKHKSQNTFACSTDALDAEQQARPQFATHIGCTAEFRTQATLFVEDSVDALIDTLSTQAFAEDQIQDSREHGTHQQLWPPKPCQLAEGLPLC